MGKYEPLAVHLSEEREASGLPRLARSRPCSAFRFRRVRSTIVNGGAISGAEDTARPRVGRKRAGRSGKSTCPRSA